MRPGQLRLCQSKEHLALGTSKRNLENQGCCRGPAWSLSRGSGSSQTGQKVAPLGAAKKKKKKSSETHRHADTQPAQISLWASRGAIPPFCGTDPLLSALDMLIPFLTPSTWGERSRLPPKAKSLFLEGYRNGTSSPDCCFHSAPCGGQAIRLTFLLLVPSSL